MADQPCFECGSTERIGTACKPCNPEITDPSFGMTQPHYIDREAVALMVRELDAKAWQSHRIGRGRAKREEHVTYRAARALEALSRPMEAVAWRVALDQLRRASVDLDEAHDMIAEWAAYADEYFQQKHDLATDLARIKLAAGEARRKYVQALAVIPTQGGGND